MKKLFLYLALITFTVTSISALEVDKNELENGGGNTTIEFINYSGPHKKIDSISAIKGIGSSLGDVVSKSVGETITAGSKAKYYVVHAVDNSESGKLDADIIFIGPDATVDHIVNLRRIISAYLSSAYGYSEKDADTLAVFITVYNAVYRGKTDVYQNKYKAVVNKYLTENCGLSVNYEDWPGKSEIVVPLFDLKDGGISTVDTSVISDTKVVESMQEDDDKNIEARKDMVDLKEREADEASDKAKASQKKATEEQKKLDEEKAKSKEAEKAAVEAKKKAEANPEDKEAQKEAVEKQQIAEKQAEKTAQQAEKTAEARQEASEKQAVADKKTSESQIERKEIAKDQQEVQNREAANAAASTEYGIVLADETKLLSRLVKFNTANGDIIKNSPVSVIRNRSVYKASEGFLAIAGEAKGNGAIKLVIIDPETMEISRESVQTIAESSVLVQDGNEYYCVIQEDKNCYVAKFDETLSMKLKSSVTVKTSTPITITDSGIVVTDNTGKLKLLNKSDLNAVTE